MGDSENTMADNQPADKQKTSKRVVKNPETFRERAIKASEGQDKPGKLSRVKQAGGKVAKPVAQPVAKAGGKVFNRKPFTYLRKPLRLIGKVLLPVYVRNSWKELRLVTWPSFREARRLTFAVMIFAAVFGIIIAGVDYGLDRLFQDILLK